MGQFPIARKTGYTEIDGAVFRLIGMALIHELLDHGDHLGNMVRGGRVVFCGLDVQRLQILEKGSFKGLGKGVKRHAGLDGTGDRLVIHIGQVHHLNHPETGILDAAAKEILKDIRPEVADMRVVIDGGSAGIEAKGLSLQRHDRFQLLSQCIVNVHGQGVRVQDSGFRIQKR